MRKNVLGITSMIVSASLSACSHNAIPIDNKKLDYDLIKDFMVPFEDIFSFQEKHYFVYIYSLHCLHCELLKNKVVDYGLNGAIKMRYIEYYEDIPILDDVSNTIGMKNIDNLGILGTPALLLVESQAIAINVSGKDMVENVLDSYN